VPVEASRYFIEAGGQWRKTGYQGSLTIDAKSLQPKRLTIETDQLTAESAMCSSSTTVKYPPGDEDVLVPSSVEIRDFDRDTAETEWIARFSDCHQAPEKAPERRPHPALFPPTWAVPFRLRLLTPIDTASAAAGDIVTARLADTILGPSPKMSAPAGAILTGRIMSMEHHLHRRGVFNAGASFLIWIDFDTIEANGVASSIRARLICGHSLNGGHGCMSATMSDQKWNRALIFESGSNDTNIVVPAGYEATWLTGDPPSR
jgi:hypothetical protein